MAVDDQDRLLDEATAVVREQAHYMERAIENDNLREALKHASNIICELRTSLLSPKNYYQLYMMVFQELQRLAHFFDGKTHKRKMSELYESVQHAGNVLPRLYLLVTVGACYIKSREAHATDILRDLCELCKGVQHPTRGLFLRYYLSQMVKDKLPDTQTEYMDETSFVEDSVEFIIDNFTESNRLWVRINHTGAGAGKDKTRRDKERKDLRVLVGANLVRLSNLDGLAESWTARDGTVVEPHEYYANNVLPRILAQVREIKDAMAQQYLLDCTIQVFPDELHLKTLEQILASCTEVQPDVDLKPIFKNLMERLAGYIHSNPEAVPVEIDIFTLFRTHLQEVLEKACAPAEGGQVDLAGLLELQVAFLRFTVSLYPDREYYVDLIMTQTVELLGKFPEEARSMSSTGVEAVVDLLAHPLSGGGNLKVLMSDCFPALMGYLSYSAQKQVATSMLEAALESNAFHNIEDVVHLETFLSFIKPLLRDLEDMPLTEEEDPEQMLEEQEMVCRMIHSIYHDNTDIQFEIFNMMRNKFFGHGGDTRMKHTLPALVYATLRILPRVRRAELDAINGGGDGYPGGDPQVSAKKVFGFTHKTCTAMIDIDATLAVQVWVACATSAHHATVEGGAYKDICSHFFVEALSVLADGITQPEAQFNAIRLLVGALQPIDTLDEDQFTDVATRLAKQAAGISKRSEQCRAIALCAHLFWCPARKESRRVLECLQKCLKVSNAAIESSYKFVGLFVELLDAFVYFFDQKLEDITAQFVGQLMTLCSGHLSYAKQQGNLEPAVSKHFVNLVKFVGRRQKLQTDDLAKDGRWSQVSLEDDVKAWA